MDNTIKSKHPLESEPGVRVIAPGNVRYDVRDVAPGDAHSDTRGDARDDERSRARGEEARASRPRVGIVTLGCDKNTVDNEYLAALIEGAGCEVVLADDGVALDAAVVTTCGFIDSAREQSMQAIADLALAKRTSGSPARLYVAGCLSQVKGEEILAKFPEIDGLVGVGQMKRLAETIGASAGVAATARAKAKAEPRAGTEANKNENGAGVSGEASDGQSARTLSGAMPSAAEPLGAQSIASKIDVAPEPTVDIYTHMKRRPLESGPHAFLKISDGCNHGCSFCFIPTMKGRLRSVEPEILLAEARDLLDRGVKEINLVAQDLSDYGRDRWKDYRLPRLLRDLCALPGDFWIRCLYYYPGGVTDEFLEVMATEEKIVPYLEMPLQHLDPQVLRRMKRPFHEVNTFDLVKRIRAAVPGVTLRTTFIVGFPGETQANFQNLLRGMQELEFDRLGAFRYSVEAATPSGSMSDQVPDKTKAQRWRMVMARQAKISEKRNKKRKGKTERVLIERYDEASGCYVGRSAKDAPNVDANVFVTAAAGIREGEFVDVRITQTEVYDVGARPIEAES